MKRTVDVTDSETDMADVHGLQVAVQIATYTTNPEFQFFRVFPDEGAPRDSHLMLAIERAIEHDEVDVLNISVGSDHITSDERDCTRSTSQCRLCEYARTADDHGIAIVAASGNRPFAEEICCPGLSDHVITVGGIEYNCSGDMPDTMGYAKTDGEIPPPNAYWLFRRDGSEDINYTGPYCSERGCGPGMQCSTNRSISLWENNVAFTSRKPDTVAPAHIVWLADDNQPYFSQGTSFSAPIVTAGIAATLEIEEHFGDLDTKYTAPEIRSAVRNSGRDIPGIDQVQFSMFAFANQLRTLRNMDPLTIERSETFEP